MHEEALGCRDSTCAILISRATKNDQKNYSLEVLTQGRYHFIFQGTSKLTAFMTNIFLKKTVYDTRRTKSSCSATGVPGSCYFDFEFGSTEVALVHVPFTNYPASSMIKVTSSCKPRLPVYLLFFGALPLVVVVSFAVVVSTTCSIFVYGPRTEAGRRVGGSSDLLLDNTMTVSENTPLLTRTQLPTYEQAVNQHGPPPDYETDID